MLKYSFHNSKLSELAEYLNLKKNQVAGFDLPAGYTCPNARDCRTFANPCTGKIFDSRHAKFRCYAASGEQVFKNTRYARWNNFDLLRNKPLDEMYWLIRNSIPAQVKIIRIHSSGDFFKRDYFQAWVETAITKPDITFFGYTKILEYARFTQDYDIPNLKLNYSYGGSDDKYIDTDRDIITYVVDLPYHARKLHVPVSCIENPADDYDYIIAGKSFAIVLHGTQRTGYKRGKG